MKYTSISDLNRYIKSSKGQENMITKNTKRIDVILKECAAELEGYLKDELSNYFTNNAEGEYYSRTGNTVNDISTLNPEKIGAGSWSIKIGMDSPHPSWVDGGKDGNTITLLDTGWKTFNTFTGLNYIDEAIVKFNKSNKYGVTAVMRRKDDTEV